MHLTPEQATLFLPFRKTSRNGAQPLRVGLVVDRDHPAPWADALLRFLKPTGMDVRRLPVAKQIGSKSTRPSWLVDRLYSLSRKKFDPFGDLSRNGPGSYSRESMDAIQADGCEVVVWLADCPNSELELAGLAQYGVFTVQFGNGNTAIPYWNEVAQNHTTSSATVLWHDVSFARGRIVGTAETSTAQGLFVTSNAEQPLVAAMRMLAALCLEIHDDAAQFEQRLRKLTVQQISGASSKPCPSNLEAARFAATKLARSAHLRWTTRGKRANWFIAIRPNRGENVAESTAFNLTGLKEIPLPRGVDAMADPFLYQAGDAQYLLFEEVASGQSRGRLGCVELSPDGSCCEMKIILERPYHLSYPCIVPLDRELFMLPETSEANRVDLYRFTRAPWEVELVATLVEGIALVDTTPISIDGHWYFFTTTSEPFMETLLFSAPRVDGPWSLHPGNPVSTSVRSCRSAGHLFWRGGRLFRPTQDCSVRYGYAIVINEVTKLTPHEFEERPVSYLPPTWNSGLLGTHTWNESSAWQVIDGIRYTP